MSTTLTHYKSISQTLVTSSLALSAAIYLLYSSAKSKERHHEDGSKVRKIIPQAPMGLMQLIVGLTGFDCPDFVLKISRDLNSTIFRLANFEYISGGKMTVMIGDAKAAIQVLTDPLSTKPSSVYSPFNKVTKGYPVMFTSSSDAWHSRRKGVSPAFSSKHVKRMNEVAAQKVDEWINTRLSSFIEKDEAFDVGKEMLRITLSAISETAFEYVISDEEMEEYEHELELATIEFFLKSSSNPFRQVFGLFLSDRRRAYVAVDRVMNFIHKIIESYRKLENPTKDTIIYRIMTSKAYKNDMERAAEVSSLLVGGHDTTAYSIAWTLKELSKNPSLQQDLRKSLSNYKKDEYDKSPVLRNIAREGIRLHPVSGFGSIRKLGKELITEQGYVLPKDAVIFMPFYIMMRNQNVFKDADSFIPSRWENATEEMNRSFMPFSAGKQNCIGQSLANAEILNIIPRIVAQFELELVEEGTSEFFLTLKPRNTMIKAKRLEGAK